MKIISKFKDYYDHVVHPTMIDERVKFVRHTSFADYDNDIFKNVPETYNSFISFRYIDENGKPVYHRWSNYYSLTKYSDILIIGSKAFRIITDYVTDEDIDFRKNNLDRSYGAPTANAFVKEYNKRVDTLNNEYRIEPDGDNSKIKLGLIEGFDATNISLHYETPVLVVVYHKDNYYSYGSKRKVLLNPCLSCYNMDSIIDPYTVWQEISMFIGGVMPGACSPMVKITDDKIKLRKAGFDEKYGFRKRPTGQS